jgi:hypothetical protein
MNRSGRWDSVRKKGRKIVVVQLDAKIYRKKVKRTKWMKIGSKWGRIRG